MSYNAIPPPQEESSDAYLPSPPLEPSDSVPVTDPTVAHASLTEINEAPVVNGTAEEAPPPYAPQQTGIDSGAANAAAESHWDSKMSTSIEGPEGWVKVARDPSEIETGPAATTAAASGTQSWADDQPTVEAEPATSLPRTSSANANSNDGFHEVRHSRGSGRGNYNGEHRGGFRGRGGHRGDRGEGGGYRGRGGYRGNRGSPGDPGFRGRGRGRGSRGGETPRRSEQS